MSTYYLAEQRIAQHQPHLMRDVADVTPLANSLAVLFNLQLSGTCVEMKSGGAEI